MYGWSSSAPGLSASCELTFAPPWVCDMAISSSASSSPARRMIASRSPRASGRYWNQPTSSATSASVGPSPSSGANTAAVAANGRWTPSAASWVAAPQERA